MSSNSIHSSVGRWGPMPRLKLRRWQVPAMLMPRGRMLSEETKTELASPDIATAREYRSSAGICLLHRSRCRTQPTQIDTRSCPIAPAVALPLSMTTGCTLPRQPGLPALRIKSGLPWKAYLQICFLQIAEPGRGTLENRIPTKTRSNS